MSEILFVLILSMMILSAGIGMSYANAGSVSGVTPLNPIPILPITVTTDKTTYSDGDIILVSGTVRDYNYGTAVTIKVRAPNNNIAFIGQTSVSDNGVYSTTIKAGGNLWRDAGKYEIDVKSGNRSTVTTFQFGGHIPFSIMPISGGNNLSISYNIVGGQLLDARPDTKTKSLLLTVSTTGNGTLILFLPSSVIDSQIDGQNIPFTVIISGTVVNHTEEPGTFGRTLTIPFNEGTTEIIIAGTKVIPEFGAMAGLVFVIAILATVMVFTKSGSRINRVAFSR